MSPTPQQIGHRIKQLREDREISQYELAKRSKLSREYIRKLEAGASDPTVGVLERIANALDVTLIGLLRTTKKR